MDVLQCSSASAVHLQCRLHGCPAERFLQNAVQVTWMSRCPVPLSRKVLFVSAELVIDPAIQVAPQTFWV